MKNGFWISGEAAYVSVGLLFNPWPESALVGESGIFSDSFYFYHSSHRIHVEQAFGVLGNRCSTISITFSILSVPLCDCITSV